MRLRGHVHHGIANEIPLRCVPGGGGRTGAREGIRETEEEEVSMDWRK